MAIRRLTALIEREGDGFVSLCPEVDVASQGRHDRASARQPPEALEPFFENYVIWFVPDRAAHTAIAQAITSSRSARVAPSRA